MAEQTSSSPPNNSPSKPQEQAQCKISLRHRIKHFTLAWFLCTMSTGGLSIALAETPHKFHGLHTIGLIIFFLNIILFTIFTSCMIARTILYPGHVKKALLHPSESLFLGSWYLSVSVILGGIQVYGITYGPAYPWLIHTIYILYWLYAALSLSNSIIQYFLLALLSPVRPIPFTPALFLPGYSAMLTGTIASIVAPYQPPARAYPVVLSGLAFQGFGWLISSLLLAQFLISLLSSGFPPPSLRPALFIPVGSVAYTIVALINLSNAIPSTGYFSTHPSAKEICQVLALIVSVFMWLFSFWLFAIAVLGNVVGAKDMQFGLSWWAYVFPNVGFMLGTNALGRELASPAILWIASVITILLVAIWMVAAIGCVRAVWTGKIVAPGKDEDRNI